MSNRTDVNRTPDVERIEKKLSEDAESLSEKHAAEKPASERKVLEGPESRDPEALLAGGSPETQGNLSSAPSPTEDDAEYDAKLVEEGREAASEEQARIARREHRLPGD